MQSSFSELEYEAKKKQTRRDRFLAEIESATPWASLTNVIAPHYPAQCDNVSATHSGSPSLRLLASQHSNA